MNKLLNRFREYGNTDRQPGSDRQKTARTAEKIIAVDDLILNQDGTSQTHRTTRQIARETGIHRLCVSRIVHKYLGLKCLKKLRAQELSAANRVMGLVRSHQLLRGFPAAATDFIFFTVEKVCTVAPPVNLQNDRVNALTGTKKHVIAAERLLRMRPTFTKSVMVSVAVSKLSCTGLVFVEPGVKANDGQYYRDVLLSQELLPAIPHITDGMYVFQQDSAPAHRAGETIERLRRETPAFIGPDLWPQNSADLNPVDFKIWRVMQERVYRSPIREVAELKQHLIDTWSGLQQCIIDEGIDQFRNGHRAFVRVNGGHFEHLL